MPKLIITRPGATGTEFAAKVAKALGRDLDTVFSPAMRIVPVEVDAPRARHLIFTSINGVKQARRLGISGPLTAWCVGDRTAAAATQAGFAAISAGGDADALVALIARDEPNGAMLHLSGRHTTGDVALRLRALGLNCVELVTYDQIPLAPSSELLTAFAGNEPLVSPVFSIRSATPLAVPDRRAPWHGIAISQGVADILTDLGVDTVATARRPNEAAMIDATCDVLTRLFDRG